MSGSERRAADEEIRAYAARLDGREPARVGLVSNPMAHTNWRSIAHERLTTGVLQPEDAVSTPTVRDLPRALDYLLFQRGCNVLAVNGGDGTIHHTVNAALEVVDAASARLGEPVPLPVFLFVQGGGINVVARAFGVHGHPVRSLARFVQLSGGRSLAALPTSDVPLLAVREPSGRTHCGFVFGSELVLNALTMYERYGRGYTGLLRLLGRAVLGRMLGTAEWRRYGHLLDPPRTPLEVDEVCHPRYAAVFASTVPLTLARGRLVSVPRIAAPGSLEGRVLTETSPARLLRLIPALVRARCPRGVRDLHGARRLRLRGPYTLDGERVPRVSSPDEAADDRIEVRATGRTIRGIRLDGPRSARS